MFWQVIRPALVFMVVMTALTGVVYPLVVTAISQLVFPDQANGSLIYDGDRLVGSTLIGQPFDGAKFFWSRPSATGPFPYNASASSGSNLGPIEPNLTAAFQSRVDALRQAAPDNELPVPVDLVTASGSGLDPHISPAAAEYQIARVAKARGIDLAAVRRLVASHTEHRTLGLLGEERVNVTTLNLALEKLKR
ncbi:MAG TPA: potassium-transporting ATPase subunit KdpC [Pirellulales bacterium]|nr:potassium-transporting ATPase subunit KdpC [Pirellulales bacterium]